MLRLCCISSTALAPLGALLRLCWAWIGIWGTLVCVVHVTCVCVLGTELVCLLCMCAACVVSVCRLWLVGHRSSLNALCSALPHASQCPCISPQLPSTSSAAAVVMRVFVRVCLQS